MASFKQGSKYARSDIEFEYFPDAGRRLGGAWDTGYINPKGTKDVVIFMNIGVPGRSLNHKGETSWDFDNAFDQETNTIRWYGKPKTNSSQPLIQKILSGEYTLHFFARWNNRDDFTYLGVGKVVTFEDGAPIKNGAGEPDTAIKFTLTIQDVDQIVEEIIPEEIVSSNEMPQSESRKANQFRYEKDLEHFIESNWDDTFLGREYTIYEEKDKSGRQFATAKGRIDILAISKDKSEFLVLELKKGRTNDAAVGQTARYMGWVKNNLASADQKVRGYIIAAVIDSSLRDAASVFPDLGVLKYQMRFDLTEEESFSQ